jgi:hypothetical protein
MDNGHATAQSPDRSKSMGGTGVTEAVFVRSNGLATQKTIQRASISRKSTHVHSAAKMTSADSNIEEYDYDSSSTRITVIIITWRSCFQSTYTLICGSTDDGPFPQGQHEESDDTSTARYADRRVLVSMPSIGESHTTIRGIVCTIVSYEKDFPT